MLQASKAGSYYVAISLLIFSRSYRARFDGYSIHGDLAPYSSQMPSLIGTLRAGSLEDTVLS
jgi:hypothetical protein